MTKETKSIEIPIYWNTCVVLELSSSNSTVVALKVNYIIVLGNNVRLETEALISLKSRLYI